MTFSRKKWWIIGSLLGVILFYTFASYGGILKQELPYGIPQIPENSATPEKQERLEYIIEEVVRDLEVPWSIVWTSPERMIIAERPGRLRQVIDGKLISKPLYQFEDVIHRSEAGLMGLAVDPAYIQNKFLYACYARIENGELIGTVVRLKDEGENATIEKILVSQIPSAQFHAGCRVAFGPDAKLYITTGDGSDRNLAQNLESLAGKILRIEPDGKIPKDNPFPDSPIWSFGHRNPQGIAWHPVSRELYETEHGPSLFDGPAGGDEVNRIIKGGNYGWPLVSHEKKKEGTIHPLLLFTPAEAPASGIFYASGNIPQFKNNFFFGALRGEGLIRVVFDEKNPDRVIEHEKVSEVRFGRIRAIAEGPDGHIYFGTSNKDGRGKPESGDDRIFRIRPK